jgi:hypothetical protein
MALDMHTRVNIKSVDLLEVNGDTVFLKVTYRVKRGRKDYKIWLLPADFRGTGIFPLCYQRLPRYANVLDMHNNVLYTGTHSQCRDIVRLANKHYMEGV